MTKQFKINGMMCEGCASAVKDLIADMPTVESVEVNLAENSAKVTANEDVTAQEIQEVFHANDKTYTVVDA